MSQHPNARLTPRGRETLVSRIEAGAGVAEAARQMGVSRQTASKWLARARRGEPMSDRSSRPRRLARLTPPDAEARVRDARSSMLLAPLALAAAAGVRHVYARPYGPWRNGKVERMNRTLAQERQYGRAWDGEAGRADALPAFVEHYNWNRPHSACGGLPPMSRIVGVNSLYWHTTPSAFSSPRAFALCCLGILAANGLIGEGCAMGFFSEFKKAMSGEEGGERYVVADKLVRCPHCGGDRFFEGSALLDSRGTSLFGVEWLGNGATTLTCANCGHVDWFADSGLIERVSG